MSPWSVFTFPGLEKCYSQLSHSPFFHGYLLSWAYFSPHLISTSWNSAVSQCCFWAPLSLSGHSRSSCPPAPAGTGHARLLHTRRPRSSCHHHPRKSLHLCPSESPTFCVPCLPPWIIPSCGWDTFSSSFLRKGYERSLWDTVLKRLYLPQAIGPWLVCTKKTKQQQNSLFHSSPLIVFWAFASTAW